MADQIRLMPKSELVIPLDPWADRHEAAALVEALRTGKRVTITVWRQGTAEAFDARYFRKAKIREAVDG